MSAQCECLDEMIDLVDRAKLAEEAVRYDDMAAAMKSVVERGKRLTLEERNLLTVAYKFRLIRRRFSWRALLAIEQKPEESDCKRQMAKEYREEVGKEIREICYELLKLVEEILLPNSGYAEAEVFYLKMKGDYYRKVGEFAEVLATEEHKKSLFEIALQAYEAAFKLSRAQLAATDPVRLALMYNFATFSFEVLTNRRKAIDLARDALNDAGDESKTPGGVRPHFKNDYEAIIRMLRDKMMDWAFSS